MGIDVLAKPVEHCDEAEQAGEVDRDLRPEETLPVECGAVAQEADQKSGHEGGHQHASQAAAQSAREEREEKEEALLYSVAEFRGCDVLPNSKHCNYYYVKLLPLKTLKELLI